MKTWKYVMALLSAAFFLTISSLSYAEPSDSEFAISDYGMLPQARAMAISPDAKYYAFIASFEGEESFLVMDAKTDKLVSGAKLGKLKARNIYFIDNDHLIFTASKTTQVFGYQGKFEGSGSVVMNLKTKKMKLLLNKTDTLYPAQSGIGRIVGTNPQEKKVYMPAYSKTSSAPPYDLYRVSLDSGGGRVYKKGSAHTIDWFMGSNGRVLAREDYDDAKELHTIYSYTSGKRKLVYSKGTAIPDIAIDGVSVDETCLVFRTGSGISQLSLSDGAITEWVEDERVGDALVEYLKTDPNRKLISIGYSGLLPFEVMVDKSLDERFFALQDGLSSSLLSLADVSADKKTLLVRVSGNQSSGAYILYNAEQDLTKSIGREYNKVLNRHIGQIVPIKYQARDGMKIPSVITWPTGVAKGTKKKLPLIVLPHGGPASYDFIKFDWWAQYLARKGYLVLQPNFRGSSGFGKSFEDAGDREWGKAMQDDVSDGVKRLVEMGYADPERVCIMGASYGGYTALAGGAFSPELYKCVVSVAGVADLPKMLGDAKIRFGKNHWVNRYWKEVIGDSKSELDRLKSISPSRFADQFRAPVLLIHGKDDVVVPYQQSKIMHKALRKSGKVVELVKLKGEDHWLSKGETRLAMLEAIDVFLDQHNPVQSNEAKQGSTAN